MRPGLLVGLTTAGTTVAVVLMAACTSGPTLTNGRDVVFPDSAVSFRNHVQPFLALSCGFAACHGETSPAGGIRLTAYTPLFIDRPNLVVPSFPDESLLVQVLEGRITHSTDALRDVSSAQIAGVRRWVKEGALNN